MSYASSESLLGERGLKSLELRGAPTAPGFRLQNLEIKSEKPSPDLFLSAVVAHALGGSAAASS